MKGDTSSYDKLSKYKKDINSIPKEASTAENTVKEREDSRADPTEKRDLTRLVDYYRLLLDTFDKERIDYTNRLDKLKIKNEDAHKLDWEYKRRKDEILELEQALYTASIALSNERKKAIHFSNEIENCKNRKKEDHRRIVQLLQLAEPIEQTIKLYEGKAPEKTEKYSNFNFESGIEEFNQNFNNVSIKRAVSSRSKSNPKAKAKVIQKNPVYRIPPSDEKQQILRTIMLPNDQKTVEINNENDTLKREIEELKAKYDTQILKLEENRKLREEEIRQKCLQYNKDSTNLLNEVQRLEKLNHEITKDIMELKYDNGLKEKKVYEDMEVTRLNNKELENNLQDIVVKGQQERQHSLKEYNKKTREITACLRGQVRAQEESANIIKEQYSQIQKIYNSKVKNLTDQLNNMANKCKEIEGKKNLDVEGYVNEIKLMRQRLSSYQNFVRKIIYQISKRQNVDNMEKDNINNNYNEQEYAQGNNPERSDEEEEQYQGDDNYEEQESNNQ